MILTDRDILAIEGLRAPANGTQKSASLFCVQRGGKL